MHNVNIYDVILDKCTIYVQRFVSLSLIEILLTQILLIIHSFIENVGSDLHFRYLLKFGTAINKLVRFLPIYIFLTPHFIILLIGDWNILVHRRLRARLPFLSVVIHEWCELLIHDAAVGLGEQLEIGGAIHHFILSLNFRCRLRQVRHRKLTLPMIWGVAVLILLVFTQHLKL